MFGIFKRLQHSSKPKPKGDSKRRRAAKESKTLLDGLVAEAAKDDYLVHAAYCKREGKAAVKAGAHDEAWGLFNKQKSYYMRHASKQGFTPKQTISLDAQVHEDLANILRLEKKHNDALVNIIYWVLAGNDRPTIQHQPKLKAYFNRCKFKNVELAEAVDVSQRKGELPDLREIELLVLDWKNRT